MTAALVRSVVIGLLSIGSACAIRPLLVARRMAWALLLAPYLTPTLLVGYAYGSFSLSLVRHPTANEVLYAALLWLKLTPVAAVVLAFAPQSVSAEALHCWRLLRGKADWTFRWKAGCARAPLAAFALVFLFAFGEFEMASLMNVRSWTVALFDAHAGGLALGKSLRLTMLPAMCEAAVVGYVVWWLWRARPRVEAHAHRGLGAMPRWLGWLHLIVAFVVVFCVPAAIVLRGTMQGLAAVLQNFALGKEIGASLVFAVAATSAACVLARRRTAAALALAGMFGSLVLSLVVLAVVQLPLVRALRDTPVPVILALMTVLLPFAVVLRLLVEAWRPGPSLYLARLVAGSQPRRELVWRLKVRGQFWSAFLLFAWAYGDLTAGSILAPISMTPVTVRLYNLMHYGQTAALSAMLCASFGAPLALAATVVITRRWWMRV
jgi:ABC-type Fe3+ transport system permease subunit